MNEIVLQSDSMLFNAGAETNFIYEIQHPDNTNIDVDAFNRETYGITPRISTRLLKLVEDYNAQIIFKSIQSRCFSQNLRTIDGDLPSILAHLLLIR